MARIGAPRRGRVASGSPEARRPTPEVVLGAAGTWLVAAVAVGVLGAFLGAAVMDCSRGITCLNQPIYGGLIGAGVGVLGVWLFAARLGMAWWWVPTSLALLVLGVLVGALTVDWLGAALVVGAPVLAALVSVRGTSGPEPVGSVGAPEVLRGVGTITVAAALVGGAWWLLELQGQRELQVALEETGIPLYAPAVREDLAVSGVHRPTSDVVRYSMVRRGEGQSWVTVEVTRPGDTGCREVSRLTCQDLGDGLTVARDTEADRGRVSVFRELPGAVVRLGPSPGSAKMFGWTEESLVQLARDLRAVDAPWLARRS